MAENNDQNLNALLQDALKRIEKLKDNLKEQKNETSATTERPYIPPMRTTRTPSLLHVSATNTCSSGIRSMTSVSGSTPLANFAGFSRGTGTSMTSTSANADFRRAFPSMGGTGSRQSFERRPKGGCGNIVFIKPKETWTHNFCLLNAKHCATSPSPATLMELQEAGLGKHRITFDDKKSGHGKLRRVLETTYPKLKSQGGAFELLRADGGGSKRKLLTIPMSPTGYTVSYLKEQLTCNTVLYIRPMQSNLSMVKCVTADADIQSTCRNCCREIALREMKQHLQTCKKGGQETSTNEMRRDTFDEWSGDDLDDFYNDLENSSVGAMSSPSMNDASCASGSATKSATEVEREAGMKAQLLELFPNHSEEQMDIAIFGCKSIEEAANKLLEKPVDLTDSVLSAANIQNARGKIEACEPSLQSLLENFKRRTLTTSTVTTKTLLEISELMGETDEVAAATASILSNDEMVDSLFDDFLGVNFVNEFAVEQKSPAHIAQKGKSTITGLGLGKLHSFGSMVKEERQKQASSSDSSNDSSSEEEQ
eukprot:gene21006-23058_t